MTIPGKDFETPVAFFLFNRPDTTKRVFDAITAARPKKLLLIADGPRADRPGEAEKCRAARAIVECVDWKCEVLTNFSSVNLGCKRRISSGIDWVFSLVPEAIILEDDCLPHPSFFRYCEELLGHYRDDERVMCISGDNFQFGRRRTDDSYYFSKYAHIWGWATWRRAWAKYDATMGRFPELNAGGWLRDLLPGAASRLYWERQFTSVYEGRIDTWDYQWMFCCLAHRGLTVLPNVNLVSNLGFDGNATHTKVRSRSAALPLDAVGFPLRHPKEMICDAVADQFTDELMFRLGGRRVILEQVKKLSRSVLRQWRHAEDPGALLRRQEGG